MTSSNSMYKVNLLTNENIIKSIHVFYGNDYTIGNNKLNDLFLENPNNGLFSNVFDDEELNYIKNILINYLPNKLILSIIIFN